MGPTATPTTAPSAAPSSDPTMLPSAKPSNVPTNAPTAIPTIAPSAAPTSAPTLNLPYPIITFFLNSYVRVEDCSGSLSESDQLAMATATTAVFNAYTCSTEFVNATYEAPNLQGARRLSSGALVHVRSELTTDKHCTYGEALDYFKGNMIYAVQNTSRWMDLIGASARLAGESSMLSASTSNVFFIASDDAIILHTAAYKCDTSEINSNAPPVSNAPSMSSFAFTDVLVYILVAVISVSLLYALYANRERLRAMWRRCMGARKDRTIKLRRLQFGAKQQEDDQEDEDFELDDEPEGMSLPSLRASSADWSTCSSELGSLSDLEASPVKRPGLGARRNRDLVLSTLGKYLSSSSPSRSGSRRPSTAEPVAVGIAELSPSKVRRALFESFKRKRNFRSRRTLQLQELSMMKRVAEKAAERGRVVDSTVAKLKAVKSKNLLQEEDDDLTCSSTSDESAVLVEAVPVNDAAAVAKLLSSGDELARKQHHALNLKELGFMSDASEKKSRALQLQELGRLGRTITVSPTGCAASTAKGFILPSLSALGKLMGVPRKGRGLDLRELGKQGADNASYCSTDDSHFAHAIEQKTLKRTASMPTKKSAHVGPRVSRVLYLQELGRPQHPEAAGSYSTDDSHLAHAIEQKTLKRTASMPTKKAARSARRTLDLQELGRQQHPEVAGSYSTDESHVAHAIEQKTLKRTASMPAKKAHVTRTMLLQELGRQGGHKVDRSVDLRELGIASRDYRSSKKDRTLALQELGAHSSPSTASAALDRQAAAKLNRTLNLHELGHGRPAASTAAPPADSHLVSKKDRALNLHELGAHGSSEHAAADPRTAPQINRKLNLQELGAHSSSEHSTPDQHLASKLNRKLNLQELGTHSSPEHPAPQQHVASKLNRKLNLQELGAHSSPAPIAAADQHVVSKLNRQLNLQELGAHSSPAPTAAADQHVATKLNRKLNLQELGAHSSSEHSTGDHHLASKLTRTLNLQELGAHSSPAPTAAADQHVATKLNRKLHLQELGAHSSSEHSTGDPHLASKLTRKLNLQELGAHSSPAPTAAADQHVASKLTRKLHLQELGAHSSPAPTAAADQHVASKLTRKLHLQELGAHSSPAPTAAADQHVASKLTRKLNLQELGAHSSPAPTAAADQHVATKLNRKLNLQELHQGAKPRSVGSTAKADAEADQHWSSDEDCESANGERLSQSSNGEAAAAAGPAEPAWLNTVMAFFYGDETKHARNVNIQPLARAQRPQQATDGSVDDFYTEDEEQE
jgi:hypothetical protein